MEQYKHGDPTVDLLAKAKSDIAADMLQRGIGAVIWDNATAGFPYLPEITLPASDPEKAPEVVSVMGLYLYSGELYLIEEDKAGFSMRDFYNEDTEAAPSVVTLTADIAQKDLGDPKGREGFTTDGDLEEWLALADCYFQALAEE